MGKERKDIKKSNIILQAEKVKAALEFLQAF
jgi:hypothetical protein